MSKAAWQQAITQVELNDGSQYPYGLGWSLKKSALGQSKVAHGGHWRGFKADFTTIPGKDQTIIQLTNNSQDDSVDANTVAVEAILSGKPYQLTKQPVHWALHQKLVTSSVTEGKKWFRQLSTAQYEISENALNDLGYAFLGKKQFDNAIAVMELYAETYPNSANAHDSLADAYSEAGKTAMAIKHLKRVLDIDPAFEGATKRLIALKAK